MQQYSEQQRQVVFDYIEKHFGKVIVTQLEALSPKTERSSRLEICIVAPNNKFNFYRIITIGLGANKLQEHQSPNLEQILHAELMMCLPADWQCSPLNLTQSVFVWPIKAITEVAHMLIEHKFPLGSGFFIERQVPFAINTRMSALAFVNAKFCHSPQSHRLDLFFKSEALSFENLMKNFKCTSDDALELSNKATQALVLEHINQQLNDFFFLKKNCLSEQKKHEPLYLELASIAHEEVPKVTSSVSASATLQNEENNSSELNLKTKKKPKKGLFEFFSNFTFKKNQANASQLNNEELLSEQQVHAEISEELVSSQVMQATKVHHAHASHVSEIPAFDALETSEKVEIEFVQCVPLYSQETKILKNNPLSESFLLMHCFNLVVSPQRDLALDTYFALHNNNALAHSNRSFDESSLQRYANTNFLPKGQSASELTPSIVNQQNMSQVNNSTKTKKVKQSKQSKQDKQANSKTEAEVTSDKVYAVSNDGVQSKTSDKTKPKVLTLNTNSLQLQAYLRQQNSKNSNRPHAECKKEDVISVNIDEQKRQTIQAAEQQQRELARLNKINLNENQSADLAETNSNETSSVGTHEFSSVFNENDKIVNAEDCSFDFENVSSEDIIDWVEMHEQSAREKDLVSEIDPLAPANHITIFLRFCIEHKLVSEAFIQSYSPIVEKVQAEYHKIVHYQENNRPLDFALFDLRPFVVNNLKGYLLFSMLNREGVAFCHYYYMPKPPSYPNDIDTYTYLRMGVKTYYSEPLQNEAYLFLPFDNRYYTDVSKIIFEEYRAWEQLEYKDEKGAIEYYTGIIGSLAHFNTEKCIFFPAMTIVSPINKSLLDRYRKGYDAYRHTQCAFPVILRCSKEYTRTLLFNLDSTYSEDANGLNKLNEALIYTDESMQNTLPYYDNKVAETRCNLKQYKKIKISQVKQKLAQIRQAEQELKASKQAKQHINELENSALDIQTLEHEDLILADLMQLVENQAKDETLANKRQHNKHVAKDNDESISSKVAKQNEFNSADIVTESLDIQDNSHHALDNTSDTNDVQATNDAHETHEGQDTHDASVTMHIDELNKTNTALPLDARNDLLKHPSFDINYRERINQGLGLKALTTIANGNEGYSYPCLLAFYEVNTPADILTILPFTHKNLPLDALEVACIVHYFYKQYEATLCAISENSLEFIILNKLTQREALNIAKLHLLLCPNLLHKETSIETYAKALMDSRYWCLHWND